MSKIIKSADYGLLAAGVLLIVIYFAGISFKGPEALRDALDPLAPRTYLVLLPLVPGALLVCIADYIVARRRRYPQVPGGPTS